MKTTWPKLPTDFKDKWVEALESGKYKKVKQVLFEIDNSGEKCYCSLGVAASICKVPDKYIQFMSVIDKEWATKKDVPIILTGRCEKNNLVAHFIKLNDGYVDSGCKIHKPRTFKQIAQFIRKNL